MPLCCVLTGALKFKEKEVQMGGVPVGARQESMVRLNNVGDGDAAYRVSGAPNLRGLPVMG